ncbi:hypothetical protein BJX68DRAFT_205131 [Aspergillus pseudodeflectus]|uniref:RING-type domain-containing protein n=1 Tax=Aspergillus pseudodeflectus TaxID=176178 RepID=A0ABR4KVF3_9EURO
MNSEFQQPSVQDSGFPTSTLPNASHYVDYTQPFDPSTSFYELPSSASDGQGQFPPRFMTSNSSPRGWAGYSLPQFVANTLVTSTGDMAPATGYPTAPFGTNQSTGPVTSTLDNTPISFFSNVDSLGAFSPQWSTLAQSANQPVFGTSTQLVQMPEALQSIQFPYIAPMRGSFPAQFLTTIQGHRSDTTQRSTQTAQPRMRAEPPTTASEVPHFREDPFVVSQPSRSGSTSGSNHQRRHQRTNSLASPPQYHVSRHHRSRSTTHSSRSRARPQTNATSAIMRDPNYQDPEYHPSTSAPTTHTPNTTSAPPPRHSDRPDNRARLNAYLRNMHPADVQAMYEETVRHGWAQKKGLDIPQNDRPEPKETEELTLNMECKVCMAQLIDTVLLPCGHAILCRWCADQQFPTYKGQIKSKAPCPMCRETVRQRHRIYFP